jgi:hypothetical protein
MEYYLEVPCDFKMTSVGSFAAAEVFMLDIPTRST